MKQNFLACDVCGEANLRLAEERILVKTLQHGAFAVDVCSTHTSQLMARLQTVLGHRSPEAAPEHNEAPPPLRPDYNTRVKAPIGRPSSDNKYNNRSADLR